VSDELLPYYNRELAFIRSLGAEFAQTHPKIAARLRLGNEGSQDPHVERLVQAFAYLNARTRHKLDDDFPELTDALLGVLYPHYQTPVPSLAIAQFALDRGQAELTAGYNIPTGTSIDTEPVDGEALSFRTAYPVRAWPFDVVSATLAGRPIAAPVTPRSAQAVAAIRLELRTFSDGVPFSQFAPGALRFYLHPSEPHTAYELYELLLNNALEIALATSPRDPNPILLPRSSLQPIGFGRDEGLIPYSARSFLGYRLLTEYFAFPEKYLFVELTGLSAERMARFGNQLDIYIYLNRGSADLERSVSAEAFRLGCTPIVNLFPQRAEPISLTHTQTEYRVVPDARRPRSLEIYSIDRVTATSPDGEREEYLPFFSFKHAVDRASQQTFWSASRRQAAQLRETFDRDPGTDMYLTLADLGFTPLAPADWTLDIETTCSNRDLPRHLPFGGGRPYLEMPDGRGPIADVQCLTAPTPTYRPALGRGALWRVVSHLSLNHLSLADAAEGADALREILRLYDPAETAETQARIEGLTRVSSRRVVGRASGVPGGFCRGIEVELQIDEEKFSGGAYLFASVLDRFLGLYASINSFSRLVATSKQRDSQGEPWRWPARAGEQILL
jgi:type VI secretion system protein ImpG